MSNKSFEQLLDICRKTKFLEASFKDNVISNLKCSEYYQLLKQNLIREWKVARDHKIASKVLNPSYETHSDDFTYFNRQEYIADFEVLKQRENLPFSLTEIVRGDIKSSARDDEVIRVCPKEPLFLRTSYFVRKNLAKESLYQIQRQHKIRWMKYSVNPQLYSISDQKSVDNNGNSINTVSLFSSWDDTDKLEIEKINLFPAKDYLELANSDVYRFSRKKEIPWVIQSITCMETATVNILLDSLKTSEDVFKFHRRLAPYQLSIFVLDSNKDLIDLARYIELLIQRNDENIRVLNKSDLNLKNNGEVVAELNNLDKMIGIPYTIILNEKSLRTGLLKLRNRNTTLSEVIHISDIPEYIVKIFNSVR